MTLAGVSNALGTLPYERLPVAMCGEVADPG